MIWLEIKQHPLLRYLNYNSPEERDVGLMLLSISLAV